MEKELAVGLDPRGYKVTLELEIRNKEEDRQTIDLQHIDNYLGLSICGHAQYRPNCDYSYCGQIIDTVRAELKDYRRLYIPLHKIVSILYIWQRWHLNDMKAGTRSQLQAIDKYRRLADRQSPYNTFLAECEYLKSIDLLVDNGYKYGTQWLVELLPTVVELEIEKLFEGGD